MDAPRVIRIVALLLLIFTAGLITGVKLGPRFQPDTARPFLRPAPVDSERRAEVKLEEFTQRLKLTAAQRETIGPVLKGHAIETQRLNAGRRRRGRELFEQTSSRIRQQLTAEQVREYDKMLREAGHLVPTAKPE